MDLLLATLPLSLLLAAVFFITDRPTLPLNSHDSSNVMRPHEISTEINAVFDDAIQRMDGRRAEFVRNKQIVEKLLSHVLNRIRQSSPMLHSAHLLKGGSSFEGCRVSNMSDFDTYIVIFGDIKGHFKTVEVKMSNNTKLVPVVHKLKIPGDPVLLRQYPALHSLLNTRCTELMATRLKTWMFELIIRSFGQTLSSVKSEHPEINHIVPVPKESSVRTVIELRDGTKINVDIGPLIEISAVSNDPTMNDVTALSCPLQLGSRSHEPLYLFSPQAVNKDSYRMETHTHVFSVDSQMREKQAMTNNDYIRVPVRLLKSVRATRGWNQWKLGSFTLKHVVLHAYNSTCRNIDWSKKENLPKIFGACLITLDHALQQGHLSHFFTPRLNVISMVAADGHLADLTEDCGRVLQDYMSGDIDKISALFNIPPAQDQHHLSSKTMN